MLNWVHGKQEVEAVDLFLQIKEKLVRIVVLIINKFYKRKGGRSEGEGGIEGGRKKGREGGQSEWKERTNERTNGRMIYDKWMNKWMNEHKSEKGKEGRKQKVAVSESSVPWFIRPGQLPFTRQSTWESNNNWSTIWILLSRLFHQTCSLCFTTVDDRITLGNPIRKQDIL